MFDQNWLKRYMLANRPGSGKDENSSTSRTQPAQKIPTHPSQTDLADTALRERPVFNREDIAERPGEAAERGTVPGSSVAAKNGSAASRTVGFAPFNEQLPSVDSFPPQARAPPRSSGGSGVSGSRGPPMSPVASHPSMMGSPQGELASPTAPGGLRGLPNSTGLYPSKPEASSEQRLSQPEPVPQFPSALESGRGGALPPASSSLFTRPFGDQAGDRDVERSNVEQFGNVGPQVLPGTGPAPSSTIPAMHTGQPAPTWPAQTMMLDYSSGLAGPPAYSAPPSGGAGMTSPFPSGHAPPQMDSAMNMWGFNSGVGLPVKHFVLMCRDDVEIRASPTYADDARIGHFLLPGQVIVVDERRMVNGTWFIHLADGRGWVFETKDRLLVMTEAHDFERGLWHYSVVCDDDVETRTSPTYSDEARSGMCIGSGDCVAVDERCCIAGARFLKLADGRGWVFETKDRLVVMSEVSTKPREARDFERGLWHYSVVCDDDVEIRAAPTYSDEARVGLMVHPGDCVAIDERCRVAAVWYLRLADGRGWIFETKDSRRVMMPMH